MHLIQWITKIQLYTVKILDQKSVDKYVSGYRLIDQVLRTRNDGDQEKKYEDKN